MKTILLVDDERDIVDLLEYNLKKEGYQVSTASNGRDALTLAHQKPDLIILDIMMPEYDGWEVMRRLKKQDETMHIPVIFLTAKSTEIDEVVGLELGADDYLVKPVSIPKLLARVKLVLRKKDLASAPAADGSAITIGAIDISSAEHIVKVEGKEVFFPKKEFEILHYLARHHGRVVNRETLLGAVWGSDVLVVDRTIDVHIRKIREKLGRYADYIETIKGVGYRIREVG